MKAKEFEELSHACDKLLHQNLSNPQNLALSALHLLSPHPSQIEKYRFPKNTTLKKKIKFKILECLPKIGSLLWPNNISDLWRKDKVSRVDHIILSHEIGVKENKEDFYFGKIPEWLGKKNKKVLVLKINQRNWWRNPVYLPPQMAPGSATCFTFPAWGTWRLEGKISENIKSTLRHFYKNHQKPKTALGKILQAIQKREARYEVANCLRTYFWVKELLDRFKPYSIFFTWEGHPWERLVIRAAREVSPETVCIGYQHTVLFAKGLGPLRSLGKMYDPDKILTVGSPNLRQLRRAWNLQKVKILPFGSPRHVKKSKDRSRNLSPICIVAPEGILSEALRLFKFGKALADQLPEVVFHFRSHPILPFSQIASFDHELRRLPLNIKIYDYGNAEALKIARWFVYRGTSLVFEALQAGLRPLYEHKKGEISIDPLHDLAIWKRKVTSVKQAAIQIRKDIRCGENDQKIQKLAREWASDYFLKQNKTVLSLALKKTKR